MTKLLSFFSLIFTILLVSGCGESAPIESEKEEEGNSHGSTLFKTLTAEQTNVDFNNILKEDNILNFYKWDYLYNGGGVAIGDINNDGLPDIYFTSTVKSDGLFLNKGNMIF
ncbi:MAG: hypothetical protein IH946_10795, partial [Bacteroidetes bacterium]|nr:hypothetical protein [Bacteroidota bacterium]